MKINWKIGFTSLIMTTIVCLCSCQNTSELLSQLPDFTDFTVETRFTKAIQAETIYLIPPSGDFSENLLIASLQGLTAKNSKEQILITTSGIDYYQPYLTEKWGATLANTVDEQEVSLLTLAEHFKSTVNGYILCSGEGGSESVNVAISLAGILNSVIATPQTEEMLKNLGYKCILDVCDKNDSWLRSSEYWSEINKDIAIEQPNTSAPRLVDYAILCNAYFNFYNGKTQGNHTQMFEFLNDNAIVIGWNNVLGEFATVESLATLNAQLIPSDHATNLATLSGFKLETLEQKTVMDNSVDTENIHTVCIVMSDGDNLQWTLNSYATDLFWFGSPHRGNFDMAWGLPPSAIDITAPTTQYFYDNMTEKDEFIIQLSGLGYTFPSLWDEHIRNEMASQLAETMKRYDIRYAEILDDDGFYIEDLNSFTKQEEIEGLFYIGYSDYYSGYNGEILWSNGKPIVSARYSLWNGKEDGSGEIDFIADSINKASTDVKSEDSYSFIIVHCWSGLSDGNLVPDGNTMDAVAALVEKFNDNIEVVTPSEFMDRLIKNCK